MDVEQHPDASGGEEAHFGEVEADGVPAEAEFFVDRGLKFLRRLNIDPAAGHKIDAVIESVASGPENGATLDGQIHGYRQWESGYRQAIANEDGAEFVGLRGLQWHQRQPYFTTVASEHRQRGFYRNRVARQS